MIEYRPVSRLEQGAFATPKQLQDKLRGRMSRCASSRKFCIIFLTNYTGPVSVSFHDDRSLDTVADLRMVKHVLETTLNEPLHMVSICFAGFVRDHDIPPQREPPKPEISAKLH